MEDSREAVDEVKVEESVKEQVTITPEPEPLTEAHVSQSLIDEGDFNRVLTYKHLGAFICRTYRADHSG